MSWHYSKLEAARTPVSFLLIFWMNWSINISLLEKLWSGIGSALHPPSGKFPGYFFNEPFMYVSRVCRLRSQPIISANMVDFSQTCYSYGWIKSYYPKKLLWDGIMEWLYMLLVNNAGPSQCEPEPETGSSERKKEKKVKASPKFSEPTPCGVGFCKVRIHF